MFSTVDMKTFEGNKNPVDKRETVIYLTHHGYLCIDIAEFINWKAVEAFRCVCVLHAGNPVKYDKSSIDQGLMEKQFRREEAQK